MSIRIEKVPGRDMMCKISVELVSKVTHRHGDSEVTWRLGQLERFCLFALNLPALRFRELYSGHCHRKGMKAVPNTAEITGMSEPSVKTLEVLAMHFKTVRAKRICSFEYLIAP